MAAGDAWVAEALRLGSPIMPHHSLSLGLASATEAAAISRSLHEAKPCGAQDHTGSIVPGPRPNTAIGRPRNSKVEEGRERGTESTARNIRTMNPDRVRASEAHVVQTLDGERQSAEGDSDEDSKKDEADRRRSSPGVRPHHGGSSADKEAEDGKQHGVAEEWQLREATIKSKQSLRERHCKGSRCCSRRARLGSDDIFGSSSHN
jgi:hypothetical protein